MTKTDRQTDRGERFMKYGVEMGTDSKAYVPSFIMIDFFTLGKQAKNLKWFEDDVVNLIQLCRPYANFWDPRNENKKRQTKCS
jgi:hypothetical protein